MRSKSMRRISRWAGRGPLNHLGLVLLASAFTLGVPGMADAQKGKPKKPPAAPAKPAPAKPAPTPTPTGGSDVELDQPAPGAAAAGAGAPKPVDNSPPPQAGQMTEQAQQAKRLFD